MNYDIIISGGGLSGCLLAAMLRTLPLRIAIIEPKSEAQLFIDSRNLAINYLNHLLLTHYEIWPVENIPIKMIHVSEQGSFAVTRIRAIDYKIPALGYMVPYNELMKKVLNSLKNSHIDLLTQSSVIHFQNNNENIAVTIKQNNTNQQFTTKFLIAADGSQSMIRKKLSIQIAEKKFHEIAIVCQIKFTRQHNHIAFQRFTKDGVLGLLPFDPYHYTAVFSVKDELAKILLTLSDDEYSHYLQNIIGYRLGKIVAMKPRFSFPLQSIIASQLYAHNILLFGHAAHTMLPIAAQGLNLTLFDAAILTELVEKAVKYNNIDYQQIAAEYSALRKKDQEYMIAYTNRLNQLFQTKIPGVRIARNLALLFLDLIPALKQKFAYANMGYRAILPQISRRLSYATNSQPI